MEPPQIPGRFRVTTSEVVVVLGAEADQMAEVVVADWANDRTALAATDGGMAPTVAAQAGHIGTTAYGASALDTYYPLDPPAVAKPKSTDRRVVPPAKAGLGAGGRLVSVTGRPTGCRSRAPGSGPRAPRPLDCNRVASEWDFST